MRAQFPWAAAKCAPASQAQAEAEAEAGTEKRRTLMASGFVAEATGNREYRTRTNKSLQGAQQRTRLFTILRVLLSNLAPESSESSGRSASGGANSKAG